MTYDVATSVLANLTHATDTIQDNFSKAELLQAIASAYNNLGDTATAQSGLIEAMRAVESIQDDHAKKDLLSDVMSTASEFGDTAATKAVLAVALEEANNIQEKESKSKALSAILLMLDLNRVFKNDCLMRALTGLNLAAFDQLLPSFTAAYSAAHPLSPERQRAPGTGRKANLGEMEDKLFFVLVFFKCYPTFDLAGIFFDFDRSQAHRWLHRL